MPGANPKHSKTTNDDSTFIPYRKWHIRYGYRDVDAVRSPRKESWQTAIVMILL